MSKAASKSQGCAVCLIGNHTCDRPLEGPCRDCRSNILPNVNDTQRTIRHAEPLDLAAARYHIHKRTLPASLISLDTQGNDTNNLNIYVTTSTGRIRDFSQALVTSGAFITHNPAVRKQFDREIRHLFSANLKAKEGEFSMISKASTACGYIALFCSVTETIETSYTSLNGVMIANSYQHSNLKALLRDFFLCRFRELIEQVMDAGRTIVIRQNQQYCANAYAANAILYHELVYFKENLENSHLRRLLPNTLKGLLVNWFASLMRELVQRLREGCGRYPYWSYLMDGSWDDLRRDGETYKLHIWLQQNRWIPSTAPATLTPPVPPTSPFEAATDSMVAASTEVATMASHVIVGADGRLSYVDSSPRLYNPATGQAGPSTSTLDTRYDSYYGPYSGQYNS